MFLSYFKVAVRTLFRNKGYSALNIFGLALGMSVALIIGLWIFYHVSYDRSVPGYECVYGVKLRSTNNGEVTVSHSTCLPLADAIKRDVPGIQYVAQTSWIDGHLLSAGDKKIFQRGIMASEDFLHIFRYPLLAGHATQALRDPYSIVLSASTAKALFGNEEPVNKIVRLNDQYDLKVSGLLQDLAPNASMQFSFIVPFSFLIRNDEGVKQNLANWRNNSFQTFVALQSPTLKTQVESALQNLEKKYNPDDYKTSHTEPFLHAWKDWHLYTEFTNGVASGGLIDYVEMFGVIGVLVLAISCINFMNLSTARSSKRAKEVGVRKAVGSQRKALVFQFLMESIVITTVAGILSIPFVLLSMPAFESLTQSSLSIPFDHVFFWLVMVGYILLTGIAAGSRPAFYLSSFQAAKVMKGNVQTGRKASWSRRVLVALQFSCSIAFLICTIIIYQQIHHAKERPSGYNADRLMMTGLSGELYHKYDALKNALLQSGVVSGVTKSSSPVTDIWSVQRIDNWEGKLPGESLGLPTVGVTDADYFATMGMSFTLGRNFTDIHGADSLDVILNETAVKRMRLKDPLNQVITWHDNPQQVCVIGVVKDALMGSPFAQAEPMLFAYTPEWSNVITYRLSTGVDTRKALQKIAGIFATFNPSYPYEYRFVDEAYASKFSLETMIGKLAGVFAVLAITISCVGLFGLAAYLSEQRTKEIGIRKVLGSSVAQVWFLLSKEFFLLVMISCSIGSAVAFYCMNNWLQHYDYRITIRPSVFIFATILALLVTALTTSFQAVKAAVMNPVKSLRSE